MSKPLPQPPAWARQLPFFFGWTQVLVAALAMVGTLPARTQGLGLVTEGLLRDFNIDRVHYGTLNLWATLLGSGACLGFGRLIDRFGVRWITSVLAAGLGLVVIGMSQSTSVTALAVLLTLSRGLGQSALSVASLSITPQWFGRRLPLAMAVYSITLSLGFMVAFSLVGPAVSKSGWRPIWAAVGWILLLVLAPLAALLLRRNPEACGLRREQTDTTVTADNRFISRTLPEALASSSFWAFGLGSAIYALIASGVGLFNESIFVERGFSASDYHWVLAVTALTGLAGNFLAGWLATRWSLQRLMATAMALLSGGLLLFLHVSTRTGLMAQSVLMGIAGGFVTVLFFAIWGRAYGPHHLGLIQGAAQTLTVLASAMGPLIFAQVQGWTGSYRPIFWGLAGMVAVLGVWCGGVRIPPLTRAVELSPNPN